MKYVPKLNNYCYNIFIILIIKWVILKNNILLIEKNSDLTAPLKKLTIEKNIDIFLLSRKYWDLKKHLMMKL